MQRYFSKELVNNKFKLTNDDLYHIKTVMRMQENDQIEIVYERKTYLAKIVTNYEIEVIEILNEEQDNNIEYVLCIPLLKETKMDLILQKATELGVSKIIPIQTERSIIKLSNEKEDKRISRWTRICKEASEQSKRVDIPVITKVMSMNELNLDGLKIVCSTRNKNNSIKNVLKKVSKCDRIIIVIGPEGGLSTTEEDLLIDKGFIPTSLGNRIMRVETVPIYLLSILNYEMMR